MTLQTVSYPSCSTFNISDGEVTINKEVFLSEALNSNSKVPGYPWLDNQLDCGAYISAIFRRPDFEELSVRFWDCDEWVRMNFLKNEKKIRGIDHD